MTIIRKRSKMQDSVDKLIAERIRLLGEIAGIERAIELLRDDNDQSENSAPARGNAKTLLIDLLREVGSEGLNATIAEQLAKKRGKTLKRGTAGSNLSRMKADGVVTYDGNRYRLPEYTRQPPLAVVGGKNS